MSRVTDADKPLQGDEDCGGNRDGEADLGEGEDDGDDLGGDDELEVMRNMRNREDEVGEEDAE